MRIPMLAPVSESRDRLNYYQRYRLNYYQHHWYCSWAL